MNASQKRLLTRDARIRRLSQTQVPLTGAGKTNFLHHFLYIRSDSFIFPTALASTIAFLLLVGFFALTTGKLPPYVPLFYSLPWGERQLIALPFFSLLPLLIMLVFAINAVVGALLYKNYKTLVKLLFFATLLFTVLLVITAVKIVLLVKG